MTPAVPALPLNDEERELVRRAIRLNAWLMAVTVGLLTGLGLWLATAILLLEGGENVGAHLGLLGVFLPGYTVSWMGAWIGLAWGFIAGAVGGALLYRGYAAALLGDFTGQILEQPRRMPGKAPTMLISGRALGTGLGAVAALQLFAMTNWLVLRGTAQQSPHAALAAHFLPGYTVSFVGSLVGAVEIFALAFAGSLLLSAIYNTIARRRVQGRAS